METKHGERKRLFKLSRMCACAHVRMAQVLFGSDYPYRTGEDHVKGIIDYGFSQSDLDAIGRGNAQRLMPQWKS